MGVSLQFFKGGGGVEGIVSIAHWCGVGDPYNISRAGVGAYWVAIGDLEFR